MNIRNGHCERDILIQISWLDGWTVGFIMKSLCHIRQFLLATCLATLILSDVQPTKSHIYNTLCCTSMIFYLFTWIEVSALRYKLHEQSFVMLYTFSETETETKTLAIRVKWLKCGTKNQMPLFSYPTRTQGSTWLYRLYLRWLLHYPQSQNKPES